MIRAKDMGKSDVITLVLPSLPENDPLFTKKKNLLDERNICLQFQIPLSGSSSLAEPLQIIDTMIQAARILHLDETELYFIVDSDFGPFSPRNELESLNLVLSLINALILNTMDDIMDVMQVLQNIILDKIESFGHNSIEEAVIERCISGTELQLLEWGRSHGAITKLNIAYFEGAGRGALAAEDINIGDPALEIPQSIIICEDLVYESDIFPMLKEIDGITSETMLLLWSMRERYNTESNFRIYFESLPNTFNTGLSFGIDALAALEGTLLLEEILQAREHLRKQYDELCPTICSSYPDIFQPELYTWDLYLWACELWYSNGMKVVFSDGKLKTCLVPIAGLLNHSLCPHILHYGRIDTVTKSLKFCTSRTCKAGEQCYLSYGSFSGSHLVTFYGFLPKGDNPYDVIPLDIDTPGGDDNDWTTHMVRGTWLSKDNGINYYSLPTPLLAHLRTALLEDDMDLPPEIPSGAHINKDCEKAVLEMLLSIFNPMMEGLHEPDDDDTKNCSWDVRLALDFKDLQKKIVSSVLESCSSGLQALDRL